MFWISIKWLMILVVWGTLALGTYRERKKLFRSLQQPLLREEDVAGMLHMFHQRNVLLLVLVSLLLIVGVEDDVRHDRQSVSATTVASLEVTERVPVAAAPAAAVSAAAPAPAPRPAATTNSALPFTDITEFNEKNSRQQAYIDWLKQHYEDWFVTYYYLDKCGMSDPQDLSLIVESLHRELMASGGDMTVQNNIVVAANGSYNEIYSAVPCDKAHLAATKATYDANMQQLKKQAAAANQTKSDSSLPQYSPSAR